MKIWFVLFFACITAFSQAQMLGHSVIATSGEHFSHSTGSLDWTLGEIMTETFNQSNGIFTQGFQQVIQKSNELNEKLMVYPNPVPDFLQIQTVQNGEYQIEIYNIHGQRVLYFTPILDSDIILSLDMRALRAAPYMIRIHNKSSGKTATHKLIKI